MTTYSFGGVVLVQFPFTDQSSAKQRPAIVISSARYNRERPDLIILAVTSRTRDAPDYGEHSIEDWRAAGLLKPSVIKPLIATIEKSMVRKVLGQLAMIDLVAASRCLAAIIGGDTHPLVPVTVER
jgi:mRNA interferase MazF